jgi:hypothetical protein
MVRKVLSWQKAWLLQKELKLFHSVIVLSMLNHSYHESVPLDFLLLSNPTGLGYHDTYIITSTSQLDNCYTIHINMPY